MLFTCPRLVFVPRVNEVGTVWMLPASKQTNQTKQTSYEVVLGRAAHLLSKAGPWEQTRAPILPVGCRLLSAARERFQLLAVAPRLTWEPTSSTAIHLLLTAEHGTLPQTCDLHGVELTTIRN